MIKYIQIVIVGCLLLAGCVNTPMNTTPTSQQDIVKKERFSEAELYGVWALHSHYESENTHTRTKIRPDHTGEDAIFIKRG